MSSAARHETDSGMMVNAVPVFGTKCSASARNSCSASPRNGVRNHPGTLFGFSPECCSGSARNRVRVAPEYAPTDRSGQVAAESFSNQLPTRASGADDGNARRTPAAWIILLSLSRSPRHAFGVLGPVRSGAISAGVGQRQRRQPRWGGLHWRGSGRNSTAESISSAARRRIWFPQGWGPNIPPRK